MAYTDTDDPSANYQNATWSGSGGTQSITFDGNSNMQPDWVWTKPRGIAFNHALMDSSRGVGSSGKLLGSNLTSAESDINDYVMTLDSDGFSVGAGDAGFNASNDTYVSWCWKANGGTTSSNTDGSITSTVQANSDAGFSIVTYSPSNNTARNIGHGLGATPSVVITRARNRGEDWRVFHSSAGSTGSLTLNDTSAHNSNTVLHTGVASTTFGVGTDFSVNGAYNYISYVFAEKQGFSQFGSYYGNGSSTNGVFIYLGFKPAFFISKRSDDTSNWLIFDNKRGEFNLNDNYLYANSNAVEGTSSSAGVDFLSNGVRMRNTYADANTNNAKYVYLAFAENPFVTSTGIPTTAR